MISASVTVAPWSLTDLNNLINWGSACGDEFPLIDIVGSDNQLYSSIESDWNKSFNEKSADCHNVCICDLD